MEQIIDGGVYVFDIEAEFKFNIVIKYITHKKISATYLIKNSVNSKVYVGYSADFLNRISIHRTQLRGGRHRTTEMQSDFLKFGEDCFSFKILSLKNKEQYYCDKLKANLTETGYCKRKDVNSNKGNLIVVSDEARENISKALKGRLPQNWSSIIEMRRIKVDYYVDGKYIKTYNSQREAGRQTGIHYKDVNYSLRKNTFIPKNKSIYFRYTKL